jgi:hypothetical protein
VLYRKASKRTPSIANGSPVLTLWRSPIGKQEIEDQVSLVA